MATLKDHQHEMVALLAGSAVLSASGSRMAHALHDVLAYLNDTNVAPVAHTERRIEATTPGLNDALLAEAIKKCSGRIQQDIHAQSVAFAERVAKRTSAEQQIAQLENTIRQLRDSNRELRSKCNYWYSKVMALPEQSGVRKEDTQVAPCEHEWFQIGDKPCRCLKCGVKK